MDSTLTKLYSAGSTQAGACLCNPHCTLDDEILSRLQTLNHERAGKV